MPDNRWLNPLRKLVRRSATAWPHRGLVVEASLSLLFVAAGYKLAPLSWQGLREMVGATGPEVAPPRTEQNPAHAQVVHDISWAVTRSAAHLPLPSQCLAQALAARAMLRRRRIGSIIHVGVGLPGTTAFAAHAWLEAAGVEVTGYPVPAHLREIGYLISAAPQSD